jgi:hypothetical protein
MLGIAKPYRIYACAEEASNTKRRFSWPIKGEAGVVLGMEFIPMPQKNNFYEK